MNLVHLLQILAGTCQVNGSAISVQFNGERARADAEENKNTACGHRFFDSSMFFWVHPRAFSVEGMLQPSVECCFNARTISSRLSSAKI